MDRDDVARVARLARLEIDETARERFAAQLSTILDHFEVLKRIATDAVEPAAAAVDLEGRTRPDVVVPPTLRAALIANTRPAPDGSYLVPRVME